MVMIRNFLDSLVPREKRLFWTVLLASLAAHVGAFFIFQSSSASSRSISTIQPRVSIVTLNSERTGADIAAWLEMFDPSSIALPSRSPEKYKLKGEEEPAIFSEEMPQPPLPSPIFSDAQPVELVDESLPLEERAREAIAFPSAKPMPLVVETPPPLSGTEVKLAGKLAKREIVRRETLPQPRSALALRPTVARIAVDWRGNVVHALLDESCNDSSVDSLALRTLRNWRFAPVKAKKGAPDFVEWGRAIVFWDVLPSVEEQKEETP